MAGPWERFSAPQSAAQGAPGAPWTRFAAPAETPATEPDQADAGRGVGTLPFVNQAIARFAGTPVDLANLALKYAGLPVSERPLGGSASIEAGLARLGRATNTPMVPPEGAVPETVGEYVGRGVGEAAAMINPVYGGARLAASAARIAAPYAPTLGQRIARSINDAAVGTRTGRYSSLIAPGAVIGGETTAGAAGGAGRYIAEVANPDTPYAGQVGELVGGLTPGLAALALRYGPTGLAARAVGQAQEARVDPTRAPGRLQSLTADPEAAARAAEAPSIADLTPAQRTQEPRLLALERAAAQADPALEAALRERAAASQATLLEEARALGGDPAQTRAFLEGRRARLNEALEARVEQTRESTRQRTEQAQADARQIVEEAEARARQRIAELEPTYSAEDASRIVREEYDRAFNAARARVSALYDPSVIGDETIDTAPLFRRFAQLVDETPVTGREDIPAYATRFLGRAGPDEAEDEATALIRRLQPDLLPPRARSTRLGDTATPAELQTLRSNLLNIQREAIRSPSRRNEARLAGEIADLVMDALDSAPNASDALRAANEANRRLNEVFRGGGVRPLSRRGEDAEANLPPELTLERLIGSGGTRGGVAARDLIAATDESPAAQAAIQDYLMRDLRNRVVTAEGRLKPEAAESWLRRNEALLEQYPQLRESLTTALEAQARARSAAASQADIVRGVETTQADILRRAEERQKTIARRLESPRATAIARYLEGNPNDAVDRILRAENPAEVATSLRRAASRDDSGAALAGLRGAFVDNILTRARETGVEGEVFKGSTILEALQNPRQRAALEAVFSPEELNRLRQIGTEFTALERARGASPLPGGVVPADPRSPLGNFARIIGAEAASRFRRATGFGGNLQAPEIASSTARNFVNNLTQSRAEKLISRAVTDPELFAELMRSSRTSAQQEQTARRLQLWLAGPAGRALFEEESENPEQGAGAVQDIYGSVMNPAAGLASTQNLINSPAMRNRVNAIFETPAHADLFTAALNREAQLFHRANQASRGNFAGSFDQSLTNLVTQAVQNGRLNEASATRITGMLMSNEPQQVAAAVRFLENTASRR